MIHINQPQDEKGSPEIMKNQDKNEFERLSMIAINSKVTNVITPKNIVEEKPKIQKNKCKKINSRTKLKSPVLAK